MVVVELFATEPDGQRHDVAAGALDVEVAVARGVAHAVDDARGPERHPQQLTQPNQAPADVAKQVDVESQHGPQAEPRQAVHQETLEPVGGGAGAVLLDYAGLAHSAPVVEVAL